MDPLANILEQVQIANRLLDPPESASGFVDTQTRIADAERLAELVVALHEWRTAGGFDPYIT